jgi:serine/threonine-protein kinase RsbW
MTGSGMDIGATGPTIPGTGAGGMTSEGVINELVIPSDLAAARQPEQEIVDALARFSYADQAVFAIKLALEEALVNAIKHGNRSDPAKSITIRYDINAARAVIVVVDEGGGFCPATVPDCTADENLHKASGRGIMLIQAYMDQVRYSRRGNLVRMVKYNRAES